MNHGKKVAPDVVALRHNVSAEHLQDLSAPAASSCPVPAGHSRQGQKTVTAFCT